MKHQGRREPGFVISIPNRHSAACGSPPSIRVRAGNRYSYFENQYGEQFLAVHDRKTKRLCLWSGDLGWDTPFVIREYSRELVATALDGKSTILNELETRWLTAFVDACGEPLPAWKPSAPEAAAWETMRAMRYIYSNPSWSRMPAIRVFISSPFDVARERRAAVDICVELGKTLGVPIHPILWEGGGRKHPQVPPIAPALGVGTAQDAIDDAVWRAAGGCDVFVGLAWHRMGTKVRKWRSGTEAELMHALEAKRTLRRPRRIMFYHKTAPLPATVDPRQLGRLRKFLKDLRGLGLIREVGSLAEFKKDLRHHLTEAVTEILEVEPIWRNMNLRRTR